MQVHLPEHLAGIHRRYRNLHYCTLGRQFLVIDEGGHSWDKARNGERPTVRPKVSYLRSAPSSAPWDETQ